MQGGHAAQLGVDHRLHLLRAGNGLQQLPRQPGMLCALADAQHEGAQPGVVAAADACAAGHGDAVPLKVR